MMDSGVVNTIRRDESIVRAYRLAVEHDTVRHAGNSAATCEPRSNQTSRMP